VVYVSDEACARRFPEIKIFATAFRSSKSCGRNKKRQRTIPSEGDLGTWFSKVPQRVFQLKETQRRCSKVKNIDVATRLIVIQPQR
jgi:hypothetical protein